MVLIQDVVPPGGNKPRHTGKRVVRRVQQVHEATKLTNLPNSRAVRRIQSFDIISPQKTQPRSQLRPEPRSVASVKSNQLKQPMQPIPAISSKKPSRWHRLLDFAQYPLIAAVAIAAAYSSTIGQIMVLIFLIVALLSRLTSRYTFAAALLLLASVPGFQLIQQSGVAQNAAIYAYELLVVGTIQAVLELWQDNRRARKT